MIREMQGKSPEWMRKVIEAVDALTALNDQSTKTVDSVQGTLFKQTEQVEKKAGVGLTEGVVASAERNTPPQQQSHSRRNAPDSPAGTSKIRDAAVLVLFSGEPSSLVVPSDAHVVLTLRASTLRKHSGQVAFPGGGVEVGDRDPVDTALREAREETGLDTRSVSPLATLPAFHIPVSSYSVSSVLAYWCDPVPAKLSVVDPTEAVRVMYTPVEQLLDPENRFLVRQPSGNKTPAFLLDDLVVWGYTAGILDIIFRVSGWEKEWDEEDVRDLKTVLAQSSHGEGSLGTSFDSTGRQCPQNRQNSQGIRGGEFPG